MTLFERLQDAFRRLKQRAPSRPPPAEREDEQTRSPAPDEERPSRREGASLGRRLRDAATAAVVHSSAAIRRFFAPSQTRDSPKRATPARERVPDIPNRMPLALPRGESGGTERLLQAIRGILRRILETLTARLPAAASRRLRERWERRRERRRETREGGVPGIRPAVPTKGGLLSSPLAKLGMRAMVLVGVIEIVRRSLNALAEKAVQATEALQVYSGTIAAGRSRLTYEQRLAQARTAQGTQHTAAALLEAQRKLIRESVGLRTTLANLQNRIATGWIEVKRFFVDIYNKIAAVIPGLDPFENLEPQLPPIAQFLDDVAAGRFAGRKNWPPPGWKRTGEE